MRRVAIAVVLAFVAAACGDSRPTETSDGAAIRWVDVDGRTNRFNASFLSYFPSEITLHPGDQVNFRSVWSGEPHTVTLGTLVEKYLSSKAKKKPNLPTWTMGESHTLPANAARPCYLAKGAPPKETTQACDVVEQPEFNGKQTYYSSGFLPEDRVFRMKLANDIKPGKYSFFCSFHPDKMRGALTVAADGVDIPTQDDVDTEATEKLRAFIDGTLPVHGDTYEPFDRARAGRFPWPALASFETFDGAVKVLEFVPFTLKAKEDERVRWRIQGAHTIAFDAPDNAKPPAVRILNTGETEIKADAINENRSPEAPVGAPKRPVTIEASYEDGFLASGILYSPVPGSITYVVRFTDPGSYRYQCLLHPAMSGLVIVSV
jgi:plastocyanin